ncbi:hypothetical protein L1887_43410 [Cichorium endivia]|nr:hypothetical protein L1887_43410 [Cichorium endivia]
MVGAQAKAGTRSNSGERGQEARWLDADDPMQPFNVLTGNEMKSRGAMQDEGDEAMRIGQPEAIHVGRAVLRAAASACVSRKRAGVRALRVLRLATNLEDREQESAAPTIHAAHAAQRDASLKEAAAGSATGNVGAARAVQPDPCSAERLASRLALCGSATGNSAFGFRGPSQRARCIRCSMNGQISFRRSHKGASCRVIMVANDDPKSKDKSKANDDVDREPVVDFQALPPEVVHSYVSFFDLAQSYPPQDSSQSSAESSSNGRKRKGRASPPPALGSSRKRYPNDATTAEIAATSGPGASKAFDDEPACPPHFFDADAAGNYLSQVATQHFASQPAPKEGEVRERLFHQLAIPASTDCRYPDASPPSGSCWSTVQPAREHHFLRPAQPPTVDKSDLRP